MSSMITVVVLNSLFENFIQRKHADDTYEFVQMLIYHMIINFCAYFVVRVIYFAGTVVYNPEIFTSDFIVFVACMTAPLCFVYHRMKSNNIWKDSVLHLLAFFLIYPMAVLLCKLF